MQQLRSRTTTTSRFLGVVWILLLLHHHLLALVGRRHDDHDDNVVSFSLFCQALAVVSVSNKNKNKNIIAFQSTTRVDPIIQRQVNLLLQQQQDDDDDGDEDEGEPQRKQAHEYYNAKYLLQQANPGIQVWRSCLLKGRLPVPGLDFDFDDDDDQLDYDATTTTTTAATRDSCCWPPEPLFAKVCQAMAQLELPRLVFRHQGELVYAVLLTLLRMTWEFSLLLEQEAANNQQQSPEYTLEDDNIDDDDSSDDEKEYEVDTPFFQSSSVSEEEAKTVESMAEEFVASGFINEWGGVVEGISALDRLFGANHGLITLDDNDDDVTFGFGTQDGVWAHSGWKILAQLQQEQLASLPQLKKLFNQMGRRSTVHQSDAVHRFVPRRPDPQGGLGAQLDTRERRESIAGLTQSNRLSEMLPSEAVLLKASSSSASSSLLRRLFLAKMVESKLLSYQFSGWHDIESIPRTDRQRRLHNTPSAPGGPIIICLDTSWSMSGGMRETLSKAVVVAAVTAAHKQKRDCQVVAFSNAAGVMETGLLTADAKGVQRLLDFLSNSFGGGTDVTGALKHALQTLGSNDQMSSADLLLVTDGEIPDPPVPPDMMDDLDRLKRRTNMEIHGLLIGKQESVPLSKLCTSVHDFLYGYDIPGATVSTTTNGRGPAFDTTLHSIRGGFRKNKNTGSAWNIRCSRYGFGFLQQTCFQRKQSSIRHFATTRSDDTVLLYKRAKSKERKQSLDVYDDQYYDETAEDYMDGKGEYGQGGNVPVSESAKTFRVKLDDSFKKLNDAAASKMKDQIWSVKDLDKEKNAESSCWQYRGEIALAVEKVGENLVERDEESRLVVLGLVTREHVLLLGPPGTGKSYLGQRLSKLCGGSFFQRLLTRFTTPEEIFGPLSLRALENDEYRRCTEGFLPKASVAFLDEIFKANSAILNTLLTILNERQFDNGAGQREQCQIRCVVGASNEMPESDELDALYDRFLLRKEVLPVSDEGIMRILSMSTPGISSYDSDKAHSEALTCDLIFSQGLDRVVAELSTASEHVKMTEDACILIKDLRNFLKEDLDVEISDRRLVKAGRLLKVSAASHGRKCVDPIDCLLLQHIAWRFPEQRAAIRDWLWEHITPGGISAIAAIAPFRLLLNNLRNEAEVIIRKTSGDVTGSMGALKSDISAINTIADEVTSIATILQGRSNKMRRHMELLRRSTDHLWLSPDEANAAQQILLPKAASFLTEIERALADSRRLEIALREDSLIDNQVRVDIIDILWDETQDEEVSFSIEELDISMREAKAMYDTETFRRWKRARKKANKA